MEDRKDHEEKLRGSSMRIAISIKFVIPFEES